MFFLIDTGATFSFLPKFFCSISLLKPTQIKISAANNTPVKVYGELDVNFGLKNLRRSFNWTFVVADVTQAILGHDFLSHFGIIVDSKNKRLYDPHTNITMQVQLDKNTGMSFNVLTDRPLMTCPRVQELLSNYPCLLYPLQRHNRNTVNSPVHHTINTGNNNPVSCKVRRFSEPKLQCAKTEFHNLLEAGIIRPSKSPWASPLHLVPKEDSFRPVGDFRALNNVTVPDRYPIPHILSFTNQLDGMSVFSKLDLCKAYHQIPMAPEDIEKTAVLTEFGLYEYLYMPFGIKGASATFQRYMDGIFRNIPGVFVYLDDILIFSKDEDDHIKILKNVFEILAANNLRLSIKKCIFCVEQLDFLGYAISKEGIKPTETKIAAINEFPTPDSSHSLRRFLGMVGFYRRLIPHFADIALPLTELIKANPSKKQLSLSSDAKKSFADLQSSLKNLTCTAYPSRHSQLQIVTDASSVAVGGALHQTNPEGAVVPIAFFSKKLSESQKKYSAFDRELLAAYLTVLHFRPLIDGRTVTLFTDHKPLVSAYHNASLPKTDRQQRHLMILSEYINDMDFIKGSENIVSDCLSRSVNAISPDFHDLHGMADAQRLDQEIETYKPHLKQFSLNNKTELWCETSNSTPRPFVPANLRSAIFKKFHDLCHPGVKRSLKLIKSRYFWPSMDKNIRFLCDSCTACQSSKVQRHTKSHTEVIAPESNRFEDLHIDLVGPLPPSVSPITNTSFQYLLTMVDRSSRWMEAAPISDLRADTVAFALFNTWISRFGVPLHIHTDRGSQFEAELFSELSQIIGFHRLRTTSYTPQANGFIERIHRTIKNALIARRQDWIVSLPIVLLGLRCIPNETGYSPFTTVTGTTLLSPNVLHSDVSKSSKLSHNFVKDLALRMKEIDFCALSSGIHHPNSRTTYIPKELQTCTHVWVRIDRVKRPLEAPYSGPFEVVERFDKYFILKLSTGKTDAVSIDRLKPAVLHPPKPKSVTTSVPIAQPRAPPISDQQLTESSLSQTCKTRSGRTVKFATKNDYFYY